MITYEIRAQDPNGTFVKSPWRTHCLPRVGRESVMLPEDPEGIDWQELTVIEVAHYPGKVEVWIGETTNWPAGSVEELFRNATIYYQNHLP